MKLRGVIGIASVLTTLLVLTDALAQVQTPSLPNPVFFPGAPWAFAGFIVNSPKSEDWLSQSKTTISAALGKRLPDQNHTYAMTVLAEIVEREIVNETDLAGYMRLRRGKEAGKQFNVLAHVEEPVLHGGAWCSKYFLRTEDRGTGLSASVPFLMFGLACVHPERHNVVVDIGYSERGNNDLSPELKDIGDAVVASLRFVSLDLFKIVDRARAAQKQDNDDEAIKLLLPLAEQGYVPAALALGITFQFGRGAARDYAAARKWLAVAAKEGYADALYNLGTLYDKALGVERDVAEATRLFKLAADQRDPDAQWNLSVFYYKGDGVPKNLAASERWARMAADNGSAAARRLLKAPR